MCKERLILPKGYKPHLSLRETEIAIKAVKDFFESELSKALNLTRVSAPLFVERNTGLNDALNGTERPVSFDMRGIDGSSFEIVHSLAKWKRMALYRYGFSPNEGLYTDMNAIRRDEDLDNTHSTYVDQWDWERIITKEQRTEETLRSIVKTIYEVFKKTEKFLSSKYEYFDEILPEDIYFITAQELEDKYPTLTSKEREDAICREKKAVFIQGIGGALASGEKHDGRSPDYDDWSLNGDILFYYPVFDKALELSSMGIRVDETALLNQLKVSGCEDRKELDFHKKLLQGKLPYTVGGGIGQSRICMFFLRKAHVGEVQASVWPEEMIEICEEHNIHLL
ncbi:aspartate--ammonia ligase [Clostridium septicum]|uniref:Aspartate--ammonia ligase n=1 Tax=Clostridium septicum TaxID=1504 RepID=A0A9N7JMK8_CLOSE|nr:aspartate--ammonia ligase [Clostridium septicum]AYE35110.1 aspartate--ammonia ligase [Clostridium septicum]QAS60501.1 aspartate--ammonia ligase [Clostridium septicum]UEC20239.1 aspartate--ammonia ligase [Clostridium septicum]USS01707.1 aspartate--ammonia ligase [Clostridium septicum]WLF70280.1 aspartate--ammonia ligase [Clostridium septicum]